MSQIESAPRWDPWSVEVYHAVPEAGFTIEDRIVEMRRQLGVLSNLPPRLTGTTQPSTRVIAGSEVVLHRSGYGVVFGL